MKLRNRNITIVDDPNHNGRQYLWAGLASQPRRGDGTDLCRKLERNGILHSHEITDGFHAWEIAPAWVNRLVRG